MIGDPSPSIHFSSSTDYKWYLNTVESVEEHSLFLDTGEFYQDYVSLIFPEQISKSWTRQIIFNDEYFEMFMTTMINACQTLSLALYHPFPGTVMFECSKFLVILR